MIKQITNNDGSFLLYDGVDDVDIIETINASDLINIEILNNFPKSLLNGHHIKKMISNKNYNTKIIEINNLYDYEWYNLKTKEVQEHFPGKSEEWVRRLQINTEPNIKVINKHAFYDYYNSFNESITEEDLMELLKGFQGSEEDVNLVMKQLCYYDIRTFKSRIFIEYIKNVKNKNTFSNENIYTKYIRDYISAHTRLVERTYYNIEGLFNIFTYTKETDIKYMQNHYIPFLLQDIKNSSFFIKYINPLKIKINILDKKIEDDNKYLKQFINQINYDYNNKYMCYLDQSKLFISFIS